jgi:hypothetical protein
MISGTTIGFTFKLKLNEPLPRPIYKERAFPINTMLVDANGNRACLPEPTKFKVMLFSTEDPPKLIKINTAGDRIMRGTIDVQFNSGIENIVLTKVVIKEVTSHFRNG